MRSTNSSCKRGQTWWCTLRRVAFVAHGNAEDFYRVNVLGTLNLLQALAKLDRAPERVIIASSANVYGTPDVGMLDESLCPAPVNHYACSKLAMEHMVRPWFSRFPILITRPFNYTGPGQSEAFSGSEDRQALQGTGSLH